MISVTYYDSPLGRVLLAEQHQALVGVWFEGQKYYLGSYHGPMEETKQSAILQEAITWLERYFHGECPQISELTIAPKGSDFQKAVWNILCEIPYGQTITYGEISKKIAANKGLKTMSAQAVGGAVGHNPISIIIPCHRVVGTNGSLTGYAGGIERKKQLLIHEKVALDPRNPKILY